MSVKRFEDIYDMLIYDIREALPDIEILIMAPFILKGSATEENFEIFSKEVELRAEVSKRIAEKFNLEFITLQDKFDACLSKAPAEYWSFDGVHPTAQGHEIIAREWIKAFQKITKAD